MDDIYVLDEDLNVIGVIDTYNSLIWASRYNELGDFELYLEASANALELLQKNRYIARADDDTVCRINRIELDTDAESGNYLIASGLDAKALLDQRIVWGTVTLRGRACNALLKLANDAVGTGASAERQLLKSDGSLLISEFVAELVDGDASEQISYKNVGEKIREYCVRFGWGYRVILNRGGDALRMEIYHGSDKSDTVVFSDEYENLVETKYTEDASNMGNIALVAGQGEGSRRLRAVSGTAEGSDRYEIYVDARDVAQTIPYKDLTEMYPLAANGGFGYIDSIFTRDIPLIATYVYKMQQVDICIIDAAQLTDLRTRYPTGELITIDSAEYYRAYDIAIAELTSAEPEENDDVTLLDVIYVPYLLTRGYDQLAEFGALSTFEGTIDPNTTFVYKTDYYLGDIVTVENKYGISVKARIIEIVEINDENGYRVEPKFEYIKQEE